MEDIFKKYTEVVEQSLNDILKDYNLGKDDGPKIMYAKTPAAFAKFNEMIRNGKQVGPLISYNMSSVTIDKNQQMLGYGSLRVSNGGYIIQRAPLVASLEYTIDIHALAEEQANIFSLELLMKAPFARPYATMRDGQWITFTIENVSDGSSASENDIIFVRQLKLIIQRVYLDYSLKEINDNIIGDIKLKLISVEGL